MIREEHSGRVMRILAFLATIALPAAAFAQGTWRPTTTVGAPVLGAIPVGIWTGSKMIVWNYGSGGAGGAVYDPATDSWAPISSVGAPFGIGQYAALWTGSKMIAFSSGQPGGQGIYDPDTDTWVPMSATGAPPGATNLAMVWTGSKMIAWNAQARAGGLYDPATDSWAAMSAVGAPVLFQQAYRIAAVWTGSKMIIWGGDLGTAPTNRFAVGGSYDPATDTWAPISATGAPSWRQQHTAVWTGSKMIVWGGEGNLGPLRSGGVYDPATDSWKATRTAGAPFPRSYHAAVWTGARMVVWGGQEYGSGFPDSGGIYDPETDTWVAVSAVEAPESRPLPTALWTGSKIIVWGGGYNPPLNTGGILSSVAEFAKSSTSVNKASQQAVIRVSCSGLLASSTATVDYTTLDGTATAPGDYATTSGTLTFAPKALSQTFAVPLVKDTFAGGNQTLLLRLDNPQNTTLGAQETAVLTIIDRGVGGKLQFSSTGYTIKEGSGTVTLPVKRTGNMASAVTVHYDTSPGTAIGGGTDYADRSGDLTFPATGAGALVQTITVPIIQDAAAEGAERFTVLLSSPTGGAALGSLATATVTILDDEPTLEFGAATYSVKESQPSAIVAVKRSGPLTGTVKVDYAMGDVGDTATAGVDYKAASGTLTFPSGVSIRHLVVPILRDTLVEGPETVTLTLSNPVESSLGGASHAILTILDDDVTPIVQFSLATYTVNEATSRAVVTVRRTGNLTDRVTVDYAATAGSATNAPDPSADYELPSGTLSFGKGVAIRTISIPIVNDALDEGTETVNLLLTNAQNLDDAAHAAVGPLGAAVLNITDNEPTVQFSAAAYLVSEAATSALVTVRRTGSLVAPATVAYDATGGTAVRDTGSGGDYSLTAGTLSFAPGQTAKTFAIVLEPDTVSDGARTIDLALTTLTGAELGTPGQAVVTIKDNDTAGKVQFSAAQYSVGETAGTATIVVTRIGGTSSEATVGYTVSSGAGPNPAGAGDFEATSGVLTFGARETSKTFTVTIHDDGVPDAEALSVDLTLDTPDNGLALGTPATAGLWIVRQ